MKTAVIYNSQTGFTKRYAQWIADAVLADCVELSAAKNKDFSQYDAIVFGGWACGGTISKLAWFKSHIDQWKGKKLIAFCVGASPIESPQVQPALDQNFTDEEKKNVKVFYCPGGFDYEKMPLPSKLMMKVFTKVLKSKKNKSDYEQEMLKMISSSYDISDKKYIEPIIDALKE
ncbi:menaquinone-dependent protoporphyrinogen IX oxidase [Catenibacillus scindens]|uniref:Menaquinone-dependent protoporphyrinogen IX oxidase n=1 Tax=Catenibacillus scindens TaxID=673271 RepID=A0A7W8H7Y5_9FIRM|nr:flavodoxin domain-containing protein [Catenibacillus scindens]MBB5263479.1 menaquinone-dependent protoporphyrinogen IX oxidase [Catenibacillus scindens]